MSTPASTGCSSSSWLMLRTSFLRNLPFAPTSLSLYISRSVSFLLSFLFVSTSLFSISLVLSLYLSLSLYVSLSLSILIFSLSISLFVSPLLSRAYCISLCISLWDLSLSRWALALREGHNPVCLTLGGSHLAWVRDYIAATGPKRVSNLEQCRVLDHLGEYQSAWPNWHACTFSFASRHALPTSSCCCLGKPVKMRHSLSYVQTTLHIPNTKKQPSVSTQRLHFIWVPRQRKFSEVVEACQWEL